MTEVSFTLPPEDSTFRADGDNGQTANAPQWDLTQLTIGHDAASAIAWSDGVEVLNVFYEGKQIDELEADVLKILAAITATRRYAAQIAAP